MRGRFKQDGQERQEQKRRGDRGDAETEAKNTTVLLASVSASPLLRVSLILSIPVDFFLRFLLVWKIC